MFDNFIALVLIHEFTALSTQKPGLSLLKGLPTLER